MFKIHVKYIKVYRKHSNLKLNIDRYIYFIYGFNKHVWFYSNRDKFKETDLFGFWKISCSCIRNIFLGHWQSNALSDPFYINQQNTSCMFKFLITAVIKSEIHIYWRDPNKNLNSCSALLDRICQIYQVVQTFFFGDMINGRKYRDVSFSGLNCIFLLRKSNFMFDFFLYHWNVRI